MYDCTSNSLKKNQMNVWYKNKCQNGIRSIVRQLYSPTARQSDSLMGNIIFICNVREMFKISFIFSQIHGPNIEIHTLRSDSNNVSIYLIFFFYQFHAKVSYYRAVGLLSRRTIETHQSEYIYKFLCPHIYVVHVYTANDMYDHCLAICKKLKLANVDMNVKMKSWLMYF